MIWRTLFYLIIFCLDVHIKAHAVVLLPTACWEKEQTVCALENNSLGIWSAKNEEHQIALASGGILQRPSKGHFRLIKGLGWFATPSSIIVDSVYGRVSCSSGCRMMVQKNADTITVTALSGVVELLPKGFQQALNLPEGFIMSAGRVQTNGLAEVTIPHAAPIHATLKLARHVFPGNLEQLRQDLGSYFENWQEHVEAASSLHEREAARYVASVQEERRRAEAAKQAVERERRALRELFRERNDLGRSD